MNNDAAGAGIDRTTILPLLAMTVSERVNYIVSSARNTNEFFAKIRSEAPRVFEPFVALQTLVRRGVDFIVVDGLAGAVWGSPTITIETAICYRATPVNEQSLRSALADLGANGIECLVPSDYDDVLSRASHVEMTPDLKVLVCSLDDLMRMKRAANRPKDRIELETSPPSKKSAKSSGCEYHSRS